VRLLQIEHSIPMSRKEDEDKIKPSIGPI